MRRQRQTTSQHQQQQQQQQQKSTPANKKSDPTQQQSHPPPPSQSIQVRDELGKAFGNSTSLNSLLYPSAFVNLPQEVLMNLVQSGRLQVEEEGNYEFLDESHRFISG